MKQPILSTLVTLVLFTIAPAANAGPRNISDEFLIGQVCVEVLGITVDNAPRDIVLQALDAYTAQYADPGFNTSVANSNIDELSDIICLTTREFEIPEFEGDGRVDLNWRLTNRDLKKYPLFFRLITVADPYDRHGFMIHKNVEMATVTYPLNRSISIIFTGNGRSIPSMLDYSGRHNEDMFVAFCEQHAERLSPYENLPEVTFSPLEGGAVTIADANGVEIFTTAGTRPNPFTDDDCGQMYSLPNESSKIYDIDLQVPSGMLVNAHLWSKEETFDSEGESTGYDWTRRGEARMKPGKAKGGIPSVQTTIYLGGQNGSPAPVIIWPHH